MEAGRAGDVVVEGLVNIARAVAIEVAVAGDLVAARRVDDVVHNLQAERLEAAAGEAFPGELLQLLVDAADNPHVAVPRGERGALAVSEEVHAAETHAAVPRVRHGRGQHVLHVSTVRRAARGEDARHHNGFGPVGLAGLCHFVEARCPLQQRGDLARVRRVRAREAELERARTCARRDAQQHALAVSEFELRALRSAAEGDDRHLAVRGGERGLVGGDFSLRAIHFADGGEEFLRVLAEREVAHEGRDAVALDDFGALLDGRAEDFVAEGDFHAVNLQRTHAAPRARQGAEGFLARVFEGTARVRPTRLHAQAELLLAHHLRMPPVRAVEGHALGRDEAAGPPRAPAQQVLVETHRRVRAEADGDAFVRLVLAGELRADARLEEGEVVLDDAGLHRRSGFFLRLFLRLRIGGEDRGGSEGKGGSEDQRAGEF